MGLALCPVLSQSRPKWAVRTMSGLPPLATELRTSLVVRFVPLPDQVHCGKIASTRSLGRRWRVGLRDCQPKRLGVFKSRFVGYQRSATTSPAGKALRIMPYRAATEMIGCMRDGSSRSP